MELRIWFQIPFFEKKFDSSSSPVITNPDQNLAGSNHFYFQKSQFQLWVWLFKKIKLGSHTCSSSKIQTWFWSGSY